MANVQNTSAGKPSKSPDAFRTISEVSVELEVPQHVLRFWETKFSVVKPLKRGGGRRYYRPADIELIRGIRDLLYTHGFTIKGAQKLLKEQGGKIENIEVLANGRQSLAAKSVLPAGEIQISPIVTPSDISPVSDGQMTADHRADLERVLLELKEMRKMLPR
jgi:DNA-binding transcriptional MerR regulator